MGQSLWLDNITRGLLDDGVQQGYSNDLSVTGLTSDPTIFKNAIKKAQFYDTAIEQKVGIGVDALGATLQSEGAASFVTSFNELMNVLANKAHCLQLRSVGS
jgi:transaldolase